MWGKIPASEILMLFLELANTLNVPDHDYPPINKGKKGTSCKPLKSQKYSSSSPPQPSLLVLRAQTYLAIKGPY